jgi:hypothetical protein
MTNLITDPRKYPNAPECSCDHCKKQCSHPCWPLPEEAQALIDAGYGDSLMVDWWARGEDLYLLCPATTQQQGNFAPESWTFHSDTCVFFNKDGLCELHDLKLKPVEGRIAHHSHYTHRNNLSWDISRSHEHIAMTWDNEEAQKIVTKWRNEHGV